ncbi:MAG TPA: glycosyltransferase [Acidimicrobiales bacterium]|nr:glycosyltransferase [Acidimicrobiales bacterium]HVM03235.1 glycosyltransferase [Acidimicrobiales bacterium]
MRILFSTTAGAGHFGPLVPFIRSGLRNGHEVMVAAPASMEATASATGAGFWAFGDPPAEEMAAAMGSLGRLPREEANRRVVAEIFGRLDATAAVPRLRQAIREWRPDLIVRESAELGAAVAAELHDVPQVRVGIGLAEMERYVLGVVQGNVDALRRSYGLSGPNRLGESPYFTLFPAGLEGEEAVASRRFRDPAWARSAGGDPFVYVTFGSVAGALPMVTHVYGEAVRAMAGVEADVLLTIGHGADPAAVGTPPPNVRVERWVDQNEVLRRANAVVCHGGGGSTLGALAAGVPLVVVPLFASDQHINARRVAAAGAGVSVAPEAEAIRAGLEAVLAGGSFRRAAGALADELAGHPSTDEAFPG